MVGKGAAKAIKLSGVRAMDVRRIKAGVLVDDGEYTPANKTMVEVQKSSPL